MGRYATQTTVAPEQSRAEIERTLQRYGARSFMYGQGVTPEGHEMGVVAFEAFERHVRFQLPLPDRNDREFTHTPSKGLKRTEAQQFEAWQQALRQHWRALTLTIKALLEAVDTGILTFEEAFLAKIMLPDGTTVGESIAPMMRVAYEEGNMPSLLPMFDPKGARAITAK